jgi:hypothetical protein
MKGEEKFLPTCVHGHVAKSMPGPSVVVWIGFEPGVNKGAYKSGPDSALVIGRVAST